MKILTTAIIYHHHHLHFYHHNHHLHLPHHYFIVHNDMFHQNQHLHLPHHHFIVHNDMFHYRNHLYLSPAVSIIIHVITKEKKKKKNKNIDKIDDNIYELLDLAKLQLGDGLLSTLGAETEDILDDQFINLKELEEKAIE